MTGFWNDVKRRRINKTQSSLQPKDFNLFYSKVMDDGVNRTVEQNEFYTKNKDLFYNVETINPDDVNNILGRLNRGKAASIDGMTVEYLLHGTSDLLCLILSTLYSVMLSWSCIPTILHTGLIVPILKKPTRNPNTIAR
jgi:hypothetical protein